MFLPASTHRTYSLLHHLTQSWTSQVEGVNVEMRRIEMRESEMRVWGDMVEIFEVFRKY